ncbi:MAG TPA: hypothetical protein VF771_13615 [Longimicrobiaceae bacterium]
MRKIRLNVEQLDVVSFSTQSRAVPGVGTVRANGILLGDGILMGDGFDAVAPALTDTCTEAVTCATCNDPTCDSCFITRCRANCG